MRIQRSLSTPETRVTKAELRTVRNRLLGKSSSEGNLGIRILSLGPGRKFEMNLELQVLRESYFNKQVVPNKQHTQASGRNRLK